MVWWKKSLLIYSINGSNIIGGDISTSIHKDILKMFYVEDGYIMDIKEGVIYENYLYIIL